MLRRVAFLAALFAAALAFAGSDSPAFREVPGQYEFTGRMIARPVQLDAWAKRGLSLGAAETRKSAARASALKYSIEYVVATDEYTLKVPRGSNENRLAQQLLASGNFQYVEPDWRVFPVVNPNDPLFPQQWHLPKIQAPQAWDHFVGSGAVIIALCDTGVRLDHQDLAGALVSGYNAVDQLPQSGGGLVDDLSGHGTHTAGIAGAIGNNALGVSGVGWKFRIMPVRVSNQSSGNSTITILTRGARWAADNGARVVSTSYSGVSSSSVQTTGDYIKHTDDGLYVWAAGNSNSNLFSFDWPDVTIVGATDSADAKASFSSFGLAIDVFAPGVGILSTTSSSSSSCGNSSGTSMACPCAAGVGAMIMATNPTLSAQQVENILYQTCTDIGVPGEDDTFGWGRVNVYEGVKSSYANIPFLPLNFFVQFAQLTSGSVPQLYSSDDDRVVVTAFSSSAGDTVPPTIEFEANSTNGLIGTFDFMVETSVLSADAFQRAELWDWNANGWVTVDYRLASPLDQTLTLTPTSPNRFRQVLTGRIRARLSYDRVGALFGTRTWQIRIDRVNFRTAP